MPLQELLAQIDTILNKEPETQSLFSLLQSKALIDQAVQEFGVTYIETIHEASNPIPRKTQNGVIR